MNIEVYPSLYQEYLLSETWSDATFMQRDFTSYVYEL